ncbi:adagio-like protein 1 [Hordeum vulgare]|nr:adagio-like protein 1 [Hordeum vulgare]
MLRGAGPYGLVVTDALEPDCPIIYVNRGFEDATGYRAEEVLGRNWKTIPVELEQVVKRDFKVFVDLRVDNAILHFSVVSWLHLTPIYGDDDIITHYMGIQFFTNANVDLGQYLAQLQENL